MEAAADLLDELGVPARVTRASRDWLAELASEAAAADAAVAALGSGAASAVEPPGAA